MKTWGSTWQTSWGSAWGPKAHAWGLSWWPSWLKAWGGESFPQFLAPGEDISAGAWQSSSGASLFSTIDEETASDADYSFTRSHSVMEVKFGAAGPTGVTTGHIVRYRLRGNGTTDAIVRLKVGATIIATWTETNVPTTETNFAHTLDSAQATVAATNYSDLRLSVEAA